MGKPRARSRTIAGEYLFRLPLRFPTADLSAAEPARYCAAFRHGRIRTLRETPVARAAGPGAARRHPTTMSAPAGGVLEDKNVYSLKA